ncbi:hypothetical protein T11_1294 [Trichinella zimbabwensis]|uniref:Uncharacterized protein n=1 Tax=Trichinella zimbabwensis TaxID=268475 RepID=A0A0V1HCZ0_9BILA|nr:hypothetical protein T11_1294 [Trichinella zimbabwensis]
MVVKCGFSAATGQKGRGYQKSPGDLPLLYQVLFPDIKLTMHVKANDLATQSRVTNPISQFYIDPLPYELIFYFAIDLLRADEKKSIAIFISTSGDSDFQNVKVNSYAYVKTGI